MDIRAPLGTPVLAVANGVVVRVNNKETADGKYVIIRHDDVTVNGESVTLFSSYLHLESSSVEAGTKIRKGQPLGKVGLTGITTTPHLHFQIDKATAPFHVYWPYSYSDLNELGIDFFAAVNMGLGKENALKYTVHPMEFVQANSVAGAAQVAVTETSVSVASANESKNDTVSEESEPKNSAPEETKPTQEEPEDILSEAETQTVPAVTGETESTATFSDVPSSVAYRSAFDRLWKAGVLQTLEAPKFRPNDVMTRKDAAMVFGTLA